MTKRIRVILALSLLLSVVPTIPASAAGTATPTPSAAQAQHGPPATMLSLNVKKEDIAKVLAGETRALYVDRVALYSLRETSNLLEATIEIGHFRSGTQWASEDFQLSIVGQLGSSVPVLVRVGSNIVYLTSSKGLTIAIWYGGGYMLALAIRNTFTQPKELLRQALEINP